MKPFTTPQLNPASEHGWRKRWFDIIHRHDTPASRGFYVVLVLALKVITREDCSLLPKGEKIAKLLHIR